MKVVCRGAKPSVYLVAVLALVCSSLPARAATIAYTATDLTDVIPGEDLWRYDYTVSGHSFLQTDLFDILFDPLLYDSLTAGPPPNGDWDVLILQQPNPVNLPPFDTGIFNAAALSDNPSLVGSFSATFNYLGAGTPGAQPFQIFDVAGTPLDSGLTRVPGSTVIPEPSTAALFLTGVIAVTVATRRRRSRR
jgi:hypothetical protein